MDQRGNKVPSQLGFVAKHYADLAADLERDPSWFVDSVHVDARGCQEKARLISDELAAQL